MIYFAPLGSLFSSLIFSPRLRSQNTIPLPFHRAPHAHPRQRRAAVATPGSSCGWSRSSKPLAASPHFARLASPRSPRLACPRLASLDSPCSPARLGFLLDSPCLARLASPLHSLASPPRSPDLLARLASLRSSAAAPLATLSLASLEFAGSGGGGVDEAACLHMPSKKARWLRTQHAACSVTGG